jgi:transposase
MSLQDDWNRKIPEDTAQLGQTILAAGSPYRIIGDEVQDFIGVEDFAELYAPTGRGAVCPVLLALITVFQFLENMPDRVAAELAVVRLDWKYALHLPLTWTGFHFSDLSNFRKRLTEKGQERLVFDKLLAWIQDRGLIKKKGKQRTDSTHVLGLVARLSVLEMVWESLRVSLRAIKRAAPDWYRKTIPAVFSEKYVERQSDYKLNQDECRKELGKAGADGYWLLDQIEAGAPPVVQALVEVETLRTILEQQFERHDGEVSPRKPKVPHSEVIQSPHEIEVRFRKRRGKEWVGYMVQVTETAEDDEPNFITDIATTNACSHDSQALEGIHARLSEHDVQPAEHYVDQGYMSGRNLAHSRDQGINLMGKTLSDTSDPEFKQADFEIDFESRQVICPAGKASISWRDRPQEDGYCGAFVRFGEQCRDCSWREQCTSARQGRTLKISPYHAELITRRAEVETDEFKEKMKRRAAIEGTLSEMVRGHGLRRARYRGEPKVALQHLFTAAAVNLKRLTRVLADWKSPKLAVSFGC